MKRFDQIVGAYYSPEVELLKKKAWDSFKISMITGISAVALFAIFGGLVFFSVLFRYNPLGNLFWFLFLLLGGPVFLLLIPTSWMFTFRYILSCKKAKELVDSTMRASIQSEQSTPPPIPAQQNH